MNRKEFINLILDKRTLNKEVYDLTLKIDDFPYARQVLNKIWGNINLDLILKSNKIIDINIAKGDLIANTVNFINDSRLKSETKKFVDDLVDQKILGSNFDNIEITNRENKNSKKTQKIDNTSQNKSIQDPGDSSIRENINEQISTNENSQTDKKKQQLIDELRNLREDRVREASKKEVKNRDPAYKKKDISKVTKIKDSEDNTKVKEKIEDLNSEVIKNASRQNKFSLFSLVSVLFATSLFGLIFFYLFGNNQKRILTDSDLEKEVTYISKKLLKKSDEIFNCFDSEGFKLVLGINYNPISITHIYSHHPKNGDHYSVNQPLKVILNRDNEVITFSPNVDDKDDFYTDVINLKKKVFYEYYLQKGFPLNSEYKKWNCKSYEYQ